MLALVMLALAPQVEATTSTVSEFRAVLASPGGDLPFGLEIHGRGERAKAIVINGDERIEFDDASWDDLSLRIRFSPYESTLEAERDDEGVLRGTWTKQGGDAWTVMGFRAENGRTARFPREGTGAPRWFGGRWLVEFEHDEHPAVGVFEQRDDHTLTGTFLTTLGDYRYLAGVADGPRLWLSCFDGAHAFLFTALDQPDGTLRGEFWSSANWHEEWSAQRSDSAALPDPFGLTRRSDDVELGSLAYPDLDGEIRRLDDSAFEGTVRILSLFGTWCPNCNDASKYLADLHRRYAPRGLVVLGLAFEHDGDPKVAAERLNAYRDTNRIEYPVLLAGPSNKNAASRAFPFVDRVRAYPTTIFLDRDDKVLAIHTGFSGPATGPAYERLRARFESIVEDALRD